MRSGVQRAALLSLLNEILKCSALRLALRSTQAVFPVQEEQVETDHVWAGEDCSFLLHRLESGALLGAARDLPPSPPSASLLK